MGYIRRVVGLAMFFGVLGWRCTNKAKYIGRKRLQVRFMPVENLFLFQSSTKNAHVSLYPQNRPRSHRDTSYPMRNESVNEGTSPETWQVLLKSRSFSEVSSGQLDRCL
jgi:hypothetical protein